MGRVAKPTGQAAEAPEELLAVVRALAKRHARQDHDEKIRADSSAQFGRLNFQPSSKHAQRAGGPA